MGSPLGGHGRDRAGLIRTGPATPILAAAGISPPSGGPRRPRPSAASISVRVPVHVPPEGRPTITRLRSGRLAGERASSRRRLAIALGAVVLGWIAYAVYAETAAGHSLDGRVRSLQQDNARTQREIAQRQREIAAANSPAWLEEEARRLGYVKPGERIFVLVTPGASLPPDGGIDVPQLPNFVPSPSPGAPSSTASPASAASPAQPTPFYLTVPGASPPPH